MVIKKLSIVLSVGLLDAQSWLMIIQKAGAELKSGLLAYKICLCQSMFSGIIHIGTLATDQFALEIVCGFWSLYSMQVG
jgi:hypothetical protein